MKISKTISQTIACLAFLLACNSASAEFIESNDPDKFCICAYANLSNQTAQAKRAAKEKAELSALQEFIVYAVRENLILPDSLSRLSDKIKQSLIVAKSRGNIENAVVLKSLILKDGRAACVVEIPRGNLNNFKGLDVRSKPLEIINHLKEPKILKLEIALELASPAPSDILNPNSPLSRAFKKMPLTVASPLWLSSIAIDEAMLAQISDQEVVTLLEGAIATPALQDLLLSDLSKRGYVKSAQYFSGHQLLQKATEPQCVEFLKALSEDCFANSPLVNIFAKHNCSLDFANGNTENPLFDEAQQKFAGREPNFEEIEKLLFKSFLTNVNDQAINLLGRCFEEEGKYNEAVVCYFQTHSINPKNEYVEWNLANTFNKLGKTEEALYWANRTISNSSSNPWAKEMASKLIETIEQEASETPAEIEQEESTLPEL